MPQCNGKKRNMSATDPRQIAQVRVRWFGNKSSKYDGRVEDVDFDDIVEEDQEGLCVGKSIRIPWGRDRRLWTGEVLAVIEEPTPLAQALPLTRARTTRKSAAQPLSSGI